MARMYYPAWQKLVKNEEVVIVCHRNKKITVRNALYKEKSIHKCVKEATEQFSYGRLRFKYSSIPDRPDYIRIHITLNYSGENL